jgi:hypothetical protein
MIRRNWIYLVLVALLFSIGACSKPGPAKNDTPLTPPENIGTKSTKKNFKLPDNPDE